MYWKLLKRSLKSACSTKMMKIIREEFGRQKGTITVHSEVLYVKQRMGPIPSPHASSRDVFLEKCTLADINTNRRVR